MTIPIIWTEPRRDEIQLLRSAKIRRLGTHRAFLERLGREISTIEKLRAENESLKKQLAFLNQEIEALRVTNANYELRMEVLALARERILLVCANAYFVTVQDLKSRRRSLPLPWARQLAISCFQELFQLPVAVVARLFNRNEHGVIYSLQAVQNRWSWPGEKERIAQVRKLVGLHE